MKTFIVFIAILALVCLHAAGTKLIETTKEEYLKEINHIRRTAAKKYKVPSMYKLFWDDALEAKAQTQDFSENKITMRLTYRDMDPSIQIQNLDSDLAEGNRKKLLQDYRDYDMSELEEILPGQQKIGCTALITVLEYNSSNLTYYTHCFLGPHITGLSWNVTQGEPGSVCGLGFENDDGLCSPVQKATPQPQTSSPKPARLGSDSEPVQDCHSPTDGASYGQFGITLILVFSMIF